MLLATVRCLWSFLQGGSEIRVLIKSSNDSFLAEPGKMCEKGKELSTPGLQPVTGDVWLWGWSL